MDLLKQFAQIKSELAIVLFYTLILFQVFIVGLSPLQLSVVTLHVKIFYRNQCKMQYYNKTQPKEYVVIKS